MSMFPKPFVCPGERFPEWPAGLLRKKVSNKNACTRKKRGNNFEWRIFVVATNQSNSDRFPHAVKKASCWALLKRWISSTKKINLIFFLSSRFWLVNYRANLLSLRKEQRKTEKILILFPFCQNSGQCVLPEPGGPQKSWKKVCPSSIARFQQWAPWQKMPPGRWIRKVFEALILSARGARSFTSPPLPSLNKSKVFIFFAFAASISL